MGRYPEVEAVLKDYSGLDVQSIGRQLFERATESRLSLASQGSYDRYLSRLKTAEDELAELLNLLLVPETWFFRDAGAFAFLTAFVKSQWQPGNNRGIFRILSAPCSTGEEPYSIAMTLLEAGLKPAQFRIDALDISWKALLAAKAAEYAQTSFRSPLKAVQAGFFVRTEESHRLCESVRSVVTFGQGNLVDPNFMAGRERQFDAIFCKNLMIYLGETGRARVLATLNRLLKEDGLLFVGHSEVALFHQAGYSPVSTAKAFALTKARRRSEARPRRASPRIPHSRSGTQLQSGVRSDGKVEPSEDRQEKDTQSNSPGRLLEKARTLADRGQLDEAASLCSSLIGANSMDVGTYYLAGLIEQSLDRLAPAEDFFLKAIYLDPDHYETLVQLCLLSEKKGDAAKAGHYRRRIRRLEAKRE